MSKIKGKDLLKLGFEKVYDVDTEAKDGKYHYYIFETKNKKGVLISCSSDEKVNGSYEVELYEIPEIQFRNLKHLKKLVKVLKAATK